MDIQNIITLINAVSSSSITNFQIEEGNFKLTMDKLNQRIDSQMVPVVKSEADTTESIKISSAPSISAQSQPAPEIAEPEIIISNLNNICEIKSPIVGTFYSSPAPDADVFVKVGDKVKVGETLCIIEAMKLMNDIESDYDGEITEILVKNEQMVEYNQPLFRIKIDE